MFGLAHTDFFRQMDRLDFKSGVFFLDVQFLSQSHKCGNAGSHLTWQQLGGEGRGCPWHCVRASVPTVPDSQLCLSPSPVASLVSPWSVWHWGL